MKQLTPFLFLVLLCALILHAACACTASSSMSDRSKNAATDGLEPTILHIGVIDLAKTGDKLSRAANVPAGHYYFGVCLRRTDGNDIITDDVPDRAKLFISVKCIGGLRTIYHDFVSLSDLLQVAPPEYGRGKSMFFAYTAIEYNQAPPSVPDLSFTSEGLLYSQQAISQAFTGFFSLRCKSRVSFKVQVCSPDMRGTTLMAEVQLRNVIWAVNQ
jgi:hypothetical protein